MIPASAGSIKVAIQLNPKNFLTAGLLCLLALIPSVTPGAAFAADGRELKTAHDVRQKFNREDLHAPARENGEVRLIVGLRTAAESVVPGDAASDRVREQAVSARQSRVLQRLAGRNVRDIKRLRLHDFMALTADAMTIDALLADPEVTSVALDQPRYQVLQDTPGIIRASNAWAVGVRGAGQVVAVIDSGVDGTHPFFSGKVVAEACFSNPVGSNTSYCPGGVTSSVVAGSGAPCPDFSLGCWHGTHVAGIAAGRLGVLSATTGGIAPDAGIIAIQVFQRVCSTCPLTAYDSDILAALDYVLAPQYLQRRLGQPQSWWRSLCGNLRRKLSRVQDDH